MPLTKNELKLIETFCSIFNNNTKDELKVALGSKPFSKKGKKSARHYDKCQYVLEVLKKQWVSKEKNYDTIYREGYEEGIAEMKSGIGKLEGNNYDKFKCDIEELKEENKKLEYQIHKLKKEKSASIDKINTFYEEWKKEKDQLNEELAEKDATKDTEWHIWMNEELGNELYPLNPPMPTVFIKKVKELEEENEAIEERVEEEVEEALEERVEEAVEEKWQEGYDEGVLENSVDKEYLKELEDKIKTLNKENEEIRRESAEVEKAIELVGNPETIYACNNIWYK